jgi:hypothetical protein
MKKVIKLKESDLYRMVKRVLTEQNNDMNLSNWDGNIPVPVRAKINRDNNTVTSATIEFKDINIVPAVVGVLIGGGITLITKLIRNKKQKQLNGLLKEVNVALKNKLTTEEYKCISGKLSKMGKITKLNDPKKRNDSIKALNDCLGDEGRVSEIKTFLDGYIQKIENEKKYLKGIKKIK